MHRMAPLALIAVIALAGCSASIDTRMTPRPTTPVTQSPTAAPLPSITELPVAYPIDRTAELQEAAGGYLTSAAEIAEGSIELRTSIPDPRVSGDPAITAAAIGLCELVVARGATQVSMYEAGGSVFVVYGDPTHGDVCTPV